MPPQLRLPLRPGLAGCEPYGAPQLAMPVVLNVNENPYPPAEEVVRDIAAAVAVAARGANRYPDRDFTALREGLAAYLAAESGVTVPIEEIWAGNGSNEVMLHLLQAFGGPGRTVLSFAPTYSMYPEYARDTLTAWVAGSRRRGVASALSVRGNHPNLVVTRTMSKAFGMAGLRLGYLVADRRVVDALRVVRLPYHLSALTQAAALAALTHRDSLMAQVASLRAERDALLDWLVAHGFTAVPSDANFVLFGVFADRHAVWEGLLARGVLCLLYTSDAAD